MESDPKIYYLFYDRPNRQLVQLDILNSNGRGVSMPCAQGRAFYLFGRRYNKEKDFVDAVNEFNDKMVSSYYTKFRIYVPYRFRHLLLDLPCRPFQLFTEIKTKRGSFNVSDGQPLPSVIRTERFSELNDVTHTHFNIEALLELHYKFLESIVFRGSDDPRGTYYIVKCGEDTFKGYINQTGNGRFYLQIYEDATNDVVFKYYNITKEEIERFLPSGCWHGIWPETSREDLYSIMEYINVMYLAADKQSFEITETAVVSNGQVFSFKQSIKGTWYLSGNIERILKVFNVDSVKSLRKIMNSYFGAKKRFGVFPECESKEELIKFIKTLAKFK